MEILGFILSIFIGLSLGLIGGGGSILTVPILVYVFHVEPSLSTSYSLFIVGLTALIGSFNYFRNGLISLKTALIFAPPSLITVFLTRKYLMPFIPDVIGQIGSVAITKNLLIMLVFAGLMIAASVSMIRKCKDCDETVEQKQTFNYPLIFLEGSIVGVLTGFVGAGGGFLIIPALVVFAKLPMKMAVGTSLLVIAIKSLIGFSGDISAGVLIDWKFLAIVSAFTVAGIFIGSALAKKIPGEKLKPAFGWFVLVVGVLIIIKETIL
jgi:hypothetical protein